MRDMASRVDSSTALERALNGEGGAARRPTPLDALRLARRRWFAGERIDMGGLARELGISRATLYSWVGSKERLIGEVLWSFAEQGVQQAREAATGSGADYIAVARELLAEQVEAGALTPALDIDTLAYLMVRVAESFLYSDLITGSEPDVDRGVEVVRVLLHAPPLPPRRKSGRRRGGGAHGEALEGRKRVTARGRWF